MSIRRVLVPVILALCLVAGCSSGDESGSPSTSVSGSTERPRIDIDPESYVEDYENQTDTAAAAAPFASSAVAADAEGSPPLVLPPEPGIHDENTFVNPGENGFVSVADAPHSTFALDVDTGSLTVGRTFIEEAATRPPADSVRVEEWVNALGSMQAAPTEADLGLELATTRSPFDDVDVLRVGIAAREVAPEDRPPANVTFVVDTSGSMDIRERLGLVKASLALLVLNLNAGDTISVVTFDQEAAVLLEPTPVEQADTIVDAIESMGPGGGTNLQAGLLRGYAEAEASFRPDGINVVVLASDGVANIGVTGPDELVSEIRDRADAGIHLVTVGYGMGNYNDDLMEQLANQGDGFYAYLDTYQEAEQLFGDRLTSLLTVVARDAKVQVKFDDGAVESYRLLGYENRALDAEDFDDEAVDAGEVGAGHRVVALYEVRRADPTVAGSTLGQVSLRYRSGESGEQVTLSQPITVEGGIEPFESAEPDLRLQVATAAFADVLRGSAVAAERSLTIEGAHEAAVAAAADLPDGAAHGAAITPAEIVELMRLTGGLPSPPEGGSIDWD